MVSCFGIKGLDAQYHSMDPDVAVTQSMNRLHKHPISIYILGVILSSIINSLGDS
jgi:hypothetical protein